MAIVVVPGSAHLNITQRPRVNPPSVSGSTMTFTSVQVAATGTCSLSGGGADNPAGWTLGLIQLEWIETNWGHYRGQNNADGSSFIQRARPPARPNQACRDTLVPGAVLVDNSPGLDRTVAAGGAPFPVRMSAQLVDAPIEVYDLSRTNRATGKINFLHEVQLEFHFCTILTLVKPDGTYHHLKHVLWNVHWQATFKPTNFANLAAPWTIAPKAGRASNSANVSHIAEGGPTDRRFTAIATAAAAPNCNAVAGNAATNPNVKESAKWADFDVRK